MDIGGRDTFVSNMTDEKTKKVIRNRDPNFDKGTLSGEEGCSSSASLSDCFGSVYIALKRISHPDNPRSRATA
jgi:hypothetical protein